MKRDVKKCTWIFSALNFSFRFFGLILHYEKATTTTTARSSVLLEMHLHKSDCAISIFYWLTTSFIPPSLLHFFCLYTQFELFDFIFDSFLSFDSFSFRDIRYIRYACKWKWKQRAMPLIDLFECFVCVCVCVFKCVFMFVWVCVCSVNPNWAPDWKTRKRK